MASSNSPFLIFLAACFFLLASHIGPVASSLPKFDSIYQFGDSIADTGNLKRETNVSYCNFSPYGETFFGKPTGRCSNGLLIVDFFAKAFKLPFLNPYLEKDADFSHGINFAVAGATALDASRFPGAPTNSSLSVQLGWFRNHLKSVCSSSSSSGDCKRKFERTLFLVGEVGGNDYNYLLLEGKSLPDLYNLVPDVIQSITAAVKEVIDHGAVHVVVPGNFPIGCLPVYHEEFRSNDTAMYDNLGCIKPMNDFARYHNDQLKEAVKKLQKQNPGVTIHYGDYYSSFQWVLGHSASIGFEKDGVFKPCCGNATHLCGTKGSSACSDPEKRLSWDGVHLTQHAYKDMAIWLLLDIFPKTTTHSHSLSPSPAFSMASSAHVISAGGFQAVLIAFSAYLAMASTLRLGGSLRQIAHCSGFDILC